MLLIAGSGATDRDGNGGPYLRSDAYRMLADSLAARGVATLRYDKRGVGKSTVPNLREDSMRFDAAIADAVALVRHLRADGRFGNVVVAGHSEGSLVGMVAARQTAANGFVSIAGAGRNIADVLKEQIGPQLPDSTMRQRAFSSLDSLRSGQRVRQPPLWLFALLRPSVQPYMISWMRYDPVAELKAYRGPVLLVQGARDVQVPVSDAERLRQARHDGRYVVFDAMNHALKNAPADRAENLKTYTQPDRPLTPGLAQTIAEFVRQPGRKP